MKTTDIRMAFLLALLLVLPLQGQAQEVHKANSGSPQATALYPKAPNTIRLVSYNVGAFTKYTSGSYASIARMMLELDADAVAEAVAAAGRKPEEVRLVAVSKLHPAGDVAEVAAAVSGQDRPMIPAPSRQASSSSERLNVQWVERTFIPAASTSCRNCSGVWP